MTDALTKLIAAYIGIKYGLIFMFSTGDAGALMTLWHWAWGIFMILVAVGFARYQGWAFLVVSFGLIASWLLGFIGILLAADAGRSVTGPIISLVIVMVLIAIYGRWSMERRFRPHLDSDH